jgi:hypothetical protein
MKLIRQSEVYLMEEAVTESIIREANQIGQIEHVSAEKENDASGIVNVETFV